MARNTHPAVLVSSPAESEILARNTPPPNLGDSSLSDGRGAKLGEEGGTRAEKRRGRQRRQTKKTQRNRRKVNKSG